MATTHQPELSVVVPSYNRREMLSRCLDALARQTQDPTTFEVVVVDDGSTDGTTEMLEALDTPFDLRLLRQRQGGWAAAQNAGIEAAGSRLCLLIDDDIVASPELVTEHLIGHGDGQRRRIGIGALTQKPPAADDWYAETFAQEWNKHFSELTRRHPGWMDCYGGNLSAPRAALIEVGGFAADLAAAADVELAFRLCQAGCVPTYFPQARAIHDDDKRSDRMLEDARRRGVAYLQIADRHPATTGDLLGSFREATRREVALRRLLIAARIPPAPLVSIGRAIPDSERKTFWHHLVQAFALWRAVRQRVSRRRWRQLTKGNTPAAIDAGSEGNAS